MDTGSGRKIVRIAFMHLMKNNILILVAYCICGLIDNLTAPTGKPVGF